MRRIFVHEWVTGGGLAGEPLPSSLAREGAAMRRAAVEEFRALAGVEVVYTLDERFAAEAGPGAVLVGPGGEGDALSRLAGLHEDTLLIAPETGGILADRAARVVAAGGRSLGCTPEAAALAGDKLRTYEHLRRSGVPTPPTFIGRSESLPYPFVVKPRDGAGALDTFLVEGPDAWAHVEKLDGDRIIQPFISGAAMSASFLAGPEDDVQLVGVCRQELRIHDGVIIYEGGSGAAPEGPALGWPMAAVRLIDGLVGWVGVDFVADPATNQTTIIEINPRLTTSFVGLRRLCEPGAIARTWLDMLDGEPPPRPNRGLVDDGGRRVAFTANGEVTLE